MDYVWKVGFRSFFCAAWNQPPIIHFYLKKIYASLFPFLLDAMWCFFNILGFVFSMGKFPRITILMKTTFSKFFSIFFRLFSRLKWENKHENVLSFGWKKIQRGWCVWIFLSFIFSQISLHRERFFQYKNIFNCTSSLIANLERRMFNFLLHNPLI